MGYFNKGGQAFVVYLQKLQTFYSQACLTMTTRQSFLLVFRHLFDNFLMASHCIWSIKMQRLTGTGVNYRKANMALDNSASSSSRILIGQFKRKPPESC